MEDRYLFKAKRADNGEWVIGNLITNVFFRLGQSIPYILCPDKAEYDCFEDFTEENGIFEVRPDTICQCTGLRDKNGKLIWEGDIILFQRDIAAQTHMTRSDSGNGSLTRRQTSTPMSLCRSLTMPWRLSGTQ